MLARWRVGALAAGILLGFAVMHLVGSGETTDVSEAETRQRLHCITILSTLLTSQDIINQHILLPFPEWKARPSPESWNAILVPCFCNRFFTITGRAIGKSLLQMCCSLSGRAGHCKKRSAHVPTKVTSNRILPHNL